MGGASRQHWRQKSFGKIACDRKPPPPVGVHSPSCGLRSRVLFGKNSIRIGRINRDVALPELDPQVQEMDLGDTAMKWCLPTPL